MGLIIVLRFLGCVSTSELDGVLLRFMLSWEAAQRSQGSAGRTVKKVGVSNAFINSDLPENRLVLIDPPFAADLSGLLTSRGRSTAFANLLHFGQPPGTRRWLSSP